MDVDGLVVVVLVVTRAILWLVGLVGHALAAIHDNPRASAVFAALWVAVSLLSVLTVIGIAAATANGPTQVVLVAGTVTLVHTSQSRC